jgi:hypothetical protein
MPLLGFEPKIPVFERVKIFHALDSSATAIDTANSFLIYLIILIMFDEECEL